MSYARFGQDKSSVYVYLSVKGHLECCGCMLDETGNASWVYPDTDSMIAHLREHIAAGDTVPDNVIPELEADKEQNEDFIKEVKSSQIEGE